MTEFNILVTLTDRRRWQPTAGNQPLVTDRNGRSLKVTVVNWHSKNLQLLFNWHILLRRSQLETYSW